MHLLSITVQQPYAKLSSLKQHTFVDSEFLWVRDPGVVGWVLCIGLHMAVSEVLAQTGVSSKGLIGEDSPSKLCGCCQDSQWFLEGRWAESLSSQLFVGWRPPQFPLQHDSQLHQSQKTEKAVIVCQQNENQILCNLIMKVTSHHLCPILFVRTSLQAIPQFKGGYYTRA